MYVVMIATFAALAERNRFRIVELLRSGPKPVNDIGVELELSQPQVSKHLRVLKEAGLVEVTPVAQQRLYELRPEGLRSLHDWVEGYRRLWDARLDAMDELVAELEAAERSDQPQKRDGSKPKKEKSDGRGKKKRR